MLLELIKLLLGSKKNNQGQSFQNINGNGVTDTNNPAVNSQVSYTVPRPASDQGWPSKKELMIDNNNNVIISNEKSLLVSSTGEILDEQNIGCRCSICHGYSSKDQSFHCSEDSCKTSIGLCCVRFLIVDEQTKLPYCPDHYIQAKLNENLWDKIDRAVKKSSDNEEKEGG